MRKWMALVLCLAAFELTITAQDESHGVREFTDSGTWRVPPGVTSITLELWGAGGGGAGGAMSGVGLPPAAGGGGGGAGAYVRARLRVKEGETYSITIGQRGQAGRGEGREAARPGDDGGDTTLARDNQTLFVARGGRGGRPPTNAGLVGGVAGVGGAGDSTATVLIRRGNSGDPGGDRGLPETGSTPGGIGGKAIIGTMTPPGSYGGGGGDGSSFGHSDHGRPGAAGSVLLTW